MTKISDLPTMSSSPVYGDDVIVINHSESGSFTTLAGTVDNIFDSPSFVSAVSEWTSEYFTSGECEPVSAYISNWMSAYISNNASWASYYSPPTTLSEYMSGWVEHYLSDNALWESYYSPPTTLFEYMSEWTEYYLSNNASWASYDSAPTSLSEYMSEWMEHYICDQQGSEYSPNSNLSSYLSNYLYNYFSTQDGQYAFSSAMTEYLMESYHCQYIADAIRDYI